MAYLQMWQWLRKVRPHVLQHAHEWVHSPHPLVLDALMEMHAIRLRRRLVDYRHWRPDLRYHHPLVV